MIVAADFIGEGEENLECSAMVLRLYKLRVSVDWSGGGSLKQRVFCA